MLRECVSAIQRNIGRNERESFMPRYELCYILAAQVSDDQVPEVVTQIQKFITDFGGTNVQEELLGKKKLAYPIKKTRNGFYVVVEFTMDSRKVNELEAKIRTQTGTIIRHLVINIDEHLRRSAIDKVVQSTLSKNPENDEEQETVKKATVQKPALKIETAPANNTKAVSVELSSEELDKEIEAALSEDIIK